MLRLTLTTVATLITASAPTALAQDAVSLAGGIEVTPIRDATVRVGFGPALPVHPRFRPVGPTLLVRPGGSGLASFSIPAPGGGAGLVLAVESRGRRVRFGDDPAGIGVLAAHDSTLAVWLVPVTVTGGRASAEAAMVAGSRLRFGRVPDDLVPVNGETVAVGADEVTVGRGRGPLRLELASGVRVELPAAGAEAPFPGSITLRAAPSRTFRPPLRAAAPMVSLTGVQALVDSVALSLPIDRHRPGPLVVAVERVVDRGECRGESGAFGCTVRLEPDGHRLVAMEVHDGRASVTLGPELLVWRGHGSRLLVGWPSLRPGGSRGP